MHFGNMDRSVWAFMAIGVPRYARDSKQKHYPCPPRSSLRRMFTKLYGGHGPVYLKFRRSPNFWATRFTAASNSASRAFWIRKAAFMIILSPMGLLSREATQTVRRPS